LTADGVEQTCVQYGQACLVARIKQNDFIIQNKIIDYHVYSYVFAEEISIEIVEHIFHIENSMKLEEDEIFNEKFIIPSMDN